MTAGNSSGEPIGGDAGTVTAEFAVGLPGVVATVLLVLGVLLAGTTYIECQEAARAGAREAMLHASTTEARQAAQAVAGERAMVSVNIEGRWASVRVEKAILVSGFPIRVSARMRAPMEGASAQVSAPAQERIPPTPPVPAEPA